MCTDRRSEIQTKSLELLYKVYEYVLKPENEELWPQLFKGIVKSILEDIDLGIERARNTRDRKETEERLIRVADGILTATIHLIHKNAAEYGKLSTTLVRLFVEVIKEFISGSPESPLGKNAIQSLNGLSVGIPDKEMKGLGDSFGDGEWAIFVQTVSHLLKQTLPRFLLDQTEDEMSAEINDDELQEKTASDHTKDVYLRKCTMQLQLIILTQEVVSGFFDKISASDTEALLKQIEESYQLAHDFNSDIEGRYTMWKNGRLPLQSNAQSIPGLTK